MIIYSDDMITAMILIFKFTLLHIFLNFLFFYLYA